MGAAVGGAGAHCRGDLAGEAASEGGAARVGERACKVVGKYTMTKHFERSINGGAVYRRRTAAVAAEAALDGSA